MLENRIQKYIWGGGGGDSGPCGHPIPTLLWSPHFLCLCGHPTSCTPVITPLPTPLWRVRTLESHFLVCMCHNSLCLCATILILEGHLILRSPPPPLFLPQLWTALLSFLRNCEIMPRNPPSWRSQGGRSFWTKHRIGFWRKQIPESIVGSNQCNNWTVFFVKWLGIEEPEPVYAEEANAEIP